MSVAHPILLTKLKKLLCNLQNHTHPLVANNQLQLVIWKGSGELCQAKVYQVLLQHLSQFFEDRTQYVATTWSGESSLAGFLNEKLINLQLI